MSLKNRLKKLELTAINNDHSNNVIIIYWKTKEFGKLNDKLYTPEQIEELYPESKYNIINIRLDDDN